MGCIDANEVQDLMAGALVPAARAELVAHLDGCEDCRALLAQLARDAVDETWPVDADAARRIGLLDTELPSPAAALERGIAPSGGAMRDAPKRLTAASPSMTGRTLGRYAIGERIGAGAMGVVYLAHDAGLGRAIALKLLHRPDDALTDRLVREARSMAQVNHPNVVAVYDVGVIDGLTYIAMELVDGVSLRQWQQPPRQVAAIVAAYIAAGRGLAAAHAAGIVHRDFKPDNCLVGSDGRVRVTDFGLAAARPDDAPGAPLASATALDLTASGAVLGTPAYMAPEQFAGGNVDPRTDQFGFCIALYEALYGARPFAGKSFAELADAVRAGRVRPAPPNNRVSSALRAIVLRGLRVRPGDRFPTMDHLLAELGRDRARPWRWTTLAAAALAAALALGLVADLVVRDRVAAEIHESFVLTGRQTNRAWDGLTARFDASANQVYSLSVMREVASNRDQADFGLGTRDTDEANLDRIHNQLVSQDWTLVQAFAGTQHPTTIAIADYKGRMLYSSAAPTHARSDLSLLPWVRSALTQKDRAITLVRTDDPALVASGVLGPHRPLGLGLVYTRTLVLGNDKEVASAFIEEVDAAKLIGEIRLDEKTALSIVAPDGTAIGDVPPALIASATPQIAAATVEGTTYQVVAQPIRGFDNQVVGNVVMARRFDGVPLSLFPGARRTFALALLASLGVAALAVHRTRRIARA